MSSPPPSKKRMDLDIIKLYPLVHFKHVKSIIIPVNAAQLYFACLARKHTAVHVL